MHQKPQTNKTKILFSVFIKPENPDADDDPFNEKNVKQLILVNKNELDPELDFLKKQEPRFFEDDSDISIEGQDARLQNKI